MKIPHLSKSLAVLAVAALAACGGGGGGSSTSITPAAPKAGTSNPLFATFVGVGDSLTAGYQAGGLLGTNGSNPFSILPGNLVPATQENGYWALMYEQATGMTQAQMASPATSVLPLINAPGIGSQLIPVNPANFGGAPFFASHPSCDAFNESAFSAAGFAGIRANPTTPVLDVAVPGITAHEAVNMVNPLTGPPPAQTGTYPTFTCPPYLSSSTDATAGGLQSLVEGESSLYIPILGQYLSQTSPQKLSNGQPATMVNAAAMLKPTFATVWLGANDLLKFSFSGGRAPMVDLSQSDMQNDITLAVQTLQKAGAQGVAVANLPTVLETPQFFRGDFPASQALCVAQNWLFCDLTSEIAAGLIAKGVPPATAQAMAQNYATGIVKALEAQSAYGFNADSNWYLTETGFLVALGQASALIQANPANPNFAKIQLDPSATGQIPSAAPVAGSGLGGLYLSDAFAAQINGLNAAYNAGIAAAAANTGAALVDMNAVFSGIYSGTGPYFAEAASINPNPNPSTGAPFTCCSLVFGQGLLSFDGLHPSDTGYALVANAFIQAIDTKYTNANIPPLSAAQIQAIYASDPYAPH
ncbi:MAG: hypothetical protein ACYDGM_05120 [Vulcanimicrobiaceae bacterium]